MIFERTFEFGQGYFFPFVFAKQLKTQILGNFGCGSTKYLFLSY